MKNGIQKLIEMENKKEGYLKYKKSYGKHKLYAECNRYGTAIRIFTLKELRSELLDKLLFC